MSNRDFWRNSKSGRLTGGTLYKKTASGDVAYKIANEFFGEAGYVAIQTVAPFTQAATVTTGGISGLNAVADQTVAPFAQVATALYAQRQAVADQTVDPISQVATASGPARAAASGLISDPYFHQVLLLIHSNGSYVDSSSYGRTLYDASDFNGVTGGDSSTQHKFGTGAIEFPYLAVVSSGLTGNRTDSSDFDMGSGDFTLEGWTRANSHTAWRPRLEIRTSGGTPVIAIAATRSLIPAFTATVGSSVITSTVRNGGRVLLNTWQHVALSRVGGTLYLHVDGILVGTAAISGAVGASGVAFRAFFADTVSVTNSGFLGWWDEIRVTKGTGRYTTAVSLPPQAAFEDARGAPDPLVITQVATATTQGQLTITNVDTLYADVQYLYHCDETAPNVEAPTQLWHPNDRAGPSDGSRGQSSQGVQSVTGAFGGIAALFPKTITSAQIQQPGFPAVVNGRTYSNDSTTEFRFKIPTALNTTYMLLGGSNVAESLGIAGGSIYPPDHYPDFPTSDPQSGFTFYLFFRGIHGTGTPANDYDDTGRQFGLIPLAVGQWYHVAIVRSGSSVTIYLDGVKDIEFTLKESGTPNAGAYFGMFNPQFGRQVFGHFDYNAAEFAGEELRYTWAARYSGDVFDVPIAPHPGGRTFDKFTQDATVLLGSVNRSLEAAQTVAAFTQTAAVYTFGPIDAVADQTIPAFAQTATIFGPRLLEAAQTMPAFAQTFTAANNNRFAGATQLIPAFTQTAFAGDARNLTTRIDFDQLGMIVDPITQVATVTSTRTVAAAQTFVVGQVAAVEHAGVGAAAGQTVSAFGQVATAKALLALTANQIILLPTQSATIAGTRSLSASTLLAPFQQYGLIEGAYVSSSLRGYLVRPEIRTFRPPLT